MTRRGISRRRALQLAAWWIGLGASPLRALAAGDTAGDRGLLRSRESAAAIGRRYLRDHPEEARAERLAELLSLPPGGSALPGDEAARHGRRLREQHRRDLREGRVAELDGWVLSLTEARLAALAALAPPPPPR